MSDPESVPPLMVFVSTKKIVDHELKFRPDFLERSYRKGTYAAYVEVKVECKEEGVYLTVDPYVWRMAGRGYALVEHIRVREAYEAELLAAAESGGRAAVDEFPSFERWELLRKLEKTPR